MLQHLFGDLFDFNHDGQLDPFEQRAEYTAFLDEIRMQEGIETELDDMDFDELADLAAESGIDPSDFGF